jgi:sorbitol-specific phosphotransferase system component IIC
MQWLVKQSKKHRVLLYIILGLIAPFLALWATSLLWKLVKAKNRPTFVVEIVKTVATIVAGLAVYINIKQAQDRLITERFSKAIKQKILSLPDSLNFPHKFLMLFIYNYRCRDN